MLKLATIVLILLAFLIRILFIYQNGVSFHYDMARDAYAAQEIWKAGHFKILGPPTSAQGFYHGVLYYYLIAPVYWIGQGDPRLAAIFLSLVNSLAIIPLVLLANAFFGSKKWAILSGFLFAVSFEGAQYGPWISNPQPASLTVPFFFLSLWLWKKGKIYGLYLAAFFAALSVQFQFFLIYLLLLIPFFGYLFKVKNSAKNTAICFLIIIITLSNFWIAAVKFNTVNQQFFGFFNIATEGAIDFRPQFMEIFPNFLNRFVELYTLNVVPTNVVVGGIIAFSVLYVIRRERFLMFILFSNFPILLFGGHSNTYLNIGLAIPAILTVIFLLRKMGRKTVLLLVLLSLMSNFNAIVRYSPGGQVILVIPNDMNLKNELKLIDETYKISKGQPFSINTLTLPLWTNTTWAYLYSWYGQSKYGYVPSFYGRDQVGLPGEQSLLKIDKPFKNTFMIIEPGDGIPPRFYQEELETENSRTKLIKEINFASLKLQERKPIDE